MQAGQSGRPVRQPLFGSKGKSDVSIWIWMDFNKVTF
jgi:hypothetical protein